MAKVVFAIGDDVSTDTIYPGRFMATVLPSETPQFAFADFPEINGLIKAGGLPPDAVIVGGRNFGCGSSREQAASCLASVTVIAHDFARIFLQNAINVGLRTVICPTLEAEVDDELELAATEVRNLTRKTSHQVVPLPKARQAIVDAGGLIPYARKLLVAERPR